MYIAIYLAMVVVAAPRVGRYCLCYLHHRQQRRLVPEGRNPVQYIYMYTVRNILSIFIFIFIYYTNTNTIIREYIQCISH